MLVSNFVKIVLSSSEVTRGEVGVRDFNDAVLIAKKVTRISQNDVDSITLCYTVTIEGLLKVYSTCALDTSGNNNIN